MKPFQRGSLYDVGAASFREAAQAFIEGKPDFEGCNAKTMNGLKRLVGIEHTKRHKTENFER
ncbi:MAG: hypothetical protein IJT23_11635 [Clostridia bacterium]|nr:hypothetical protein [Clostridia bacterium]